MGLLLQLLVNGIFAGSVFALLALGFGLIFNTTRIFHIAHGSVYTVAAYAMFLFFSLLTLNVAVALLATIVLAAVSGVATYRYLYRPMLRSAASQLVILGASLGLLIVVTNVIPLAFGVELRTISTAPIVTASFVLGSVSFTFMKLLMLITSIVLFALLLLFLKVTQYGRELRAVANNRDLAEVVGIDVERVYLLTFALGSALTAPAAVLVGLDTGIYPTMGWLPILMASIAVIIGGVGSTGGAALGGLLLGLAQHIGVWKIASEWQTAIAFGILMVFVLFKPTGFFGQKLWESEI